MALAGMGTPRRRDGACEGPSTSGGDRYALVPYPVGHRKRDGFIANYETACVERERFFSRTNWTAAVAEALASEALGPEDRAMTLRYDQSEHPLLDAWEASVLSGGLKEQEGGFLRRLALTWLTRAVRGGDEDLSERLRKGGVELEEEEGVVV